jgi:regulator of protease activity HflC (stomatin/prohibitin superfamily)
MVERWGKYERQLSPGLSCLVWPIQRLAGKLSLRIIQDNFTCETKTKDNVFVDVQVSVQYMVLPESAYSAFYLLDNPTVQIEAYVLDTLRSSLCKLNLDEAFTAKEEIAVALKHHLEEIMRSYGFKIMNALITDMAPNSLVRAAMNEINSSKRLREAASSIAEGNKILKVKKAEAEMESMYLQGVGTARQRRAIMDGLRESIVEFSTDVQDTTPRDVMDLLVLSQYFDTLRELGANKETQVIYIASEPESGTSVKSALMQASLIKNHN